MTTGNLPGGSLYARTRIIMSHEYLGASPFLLPLMLQLGFGLSPMTSGLLTMATALGSLSTRTITTVAMRRLGFRRLLVGGNDTHQPVLWSLRPVRPTTSHVLIFCTLILGGLFNALGHGHAQCDRLRGNT